MFLKCNSQKEYICLDLEKGTYRKLQGFGQNQAKTGHFSFPQARQLLLATLEIVFGWEKTTWNKAFCCGHI